MTSRLSGFLRNIWEGLCENNRAEASFVLGDIEPARDEADGREVRVMVLYPAMMETAIARKPLYARISSQLWESLDKTTKEGLVPGAWVRAALSPASFLLEDAVSISLRQDRTPLDPKEFSARHHGVHDEFAKILARRGLKP